MIKKLLFLIFVFFAFVSNAQNVVLIEKNADKWELFEEENPYSLFSLLKNNLGILGYYNLEGLNQEKVIELRTNGNDANLLRFVFPDTSGVPLVDSNGKDSIQTIDGLEYYVYPSPDTIYADLDNISAITIEFNGNSHRMENMTRLNCWKEYQGDDQLTRCFSADAKELLKLDAFKQVVKLGDSLINELTDLNNSASMWSVMKDSALVNMRLQQRLAEEASMDIGIYNYQQFILPNAGEFYWNGIRLRLSNHVYALGVANKLQTYCEEDDPIGKMPFLVADSARFIGSANYARIMRELDSCYLIRYQPKSPLIEDDPSSPDFGMEKTFITEEGDTVFLFPDPELIYFWIDYQDPDIYITQDLVYDEKLKSTSTAVEQIYFTKKIGTDMPTLISYFTADNNDLHYFNSLETTVIDAQPWRIILNQSIQDRKNHFKLKRKCQRKKFLKRIETKVKTN